MAQLMQSSSTQALFFYLFFHLSHFQISRRKGEKIIRKEDKLV